MCTHPSIHPSMHPRIHTVVGFKMVKRFYLSNNPFIHSSTLSHFPHSSIITFYDHAHSSIHSSIYASTHLPPPSSLGVGGVVVIVVVVVVLLLLLLLRAWNSTAMMVERFLKSDGSRMKYLLWDLEIAWATFNIQSALRAATDRHPNSISLTDTCGGGVVGCSSGPTALCVCVC